MDITQVAEKKGDKNTHTQDYRTTESTNGTAVFLCAGCSTYSKKWNRHLTKEANTAMRKQVHEQNQMLKYAAETKL